MVEELNALPLTAGGGLADVKYARPLVKEQAQIQRGLRISPAWPLRC